MSHMRWSHHNRMMKSSPDRYRTQTDSKPEVEADDSLAAVRTDIPLSVTHLMVNFKAVLLGSLFHLESIFCVFHVFAHERTKLSLNTIDHVFNLLNYINKTIKAFLMNVVLLAEGGAKPCTPANLDSCNSALCYCLLLLASYSCLLPVPL